jgi:prepilin-type N-terminal cleavage/methylation domain-containing protein
MQLRKSRITIRGEKGFTLMELLLVICILGILTTIGLGEFIERRKQAYDRQAMAKAREWLTIATVAVANQDLTSITADSGTGSPSEPVFSNMDMNPPTRWAYGDAGGDVWQFYVASAAGENAYYFWIPGPACATSVDAAGYLSDQIIENPAWRITVGL